MTKNDETVGGAARLVFRYDYSFDNTLFSLITSPTPFNRRNIHKMPNMYIRLLRSPFLIVYYVRVERRTQQHLQSNQK